MVALCHTELLPQRKKGISPSFAAYSGPLLDIFRKFPGFMRDKNSGEGETASIPKE